MKCQQAHENLAAYLHHELAPFQETAVEQHLAACEHCRGEMEALRAMLRTIRQTVPVEPSASSRLRTQQAIGDGIAGAGRGHTAQLTRPNNPANWEMVLPPPQRPALPHEARKALPAPAMSAGLASTSGTVSESAHSIASVTPSSRSGRLLAAPRNQLRSILRVYALFMVILLGALAILSVYAALHTRPTLYNPEVRVQRVAANFRWDDRHAAKLHGNVEDVFVVNDNVPVNEALLAGGALFVVPHDDPRTGEVSLIGYRESDIGLIRNDDSIDQFAFSRLLATAVKLTSPDGKADLPHHLIEQCIGGDNRASIVVLRNRVEIWSAARLERYLATDATFKYDQAHTRPAANGLPPELAKP